MTFHSSLYEPETGWISHYNNLLACKYIEILKQLTYVYMNNRQWSQTTQPWTSLCFTASNGSSFLVAHRGNGYALRAYHQMMMMMMTYVT